MQKNKLQNYLHLHFIVFIWGFTAILGKLISIDAIPLVWFRLSIASVLLFIYIIITKINLKVDLKTLLLFFTVGSIIGLHWLAFFYAIKIANISITLTTLATGAFFTSILEPIFYKTKLKWYEVLLSLLTVFGIVIIYNVEAQYSLGIIFALIAALLSALFTVANASLVQKTNTSVLTFYELLFATLVISIILFYNNGYTKNFFNLSTNDWIFIFILGSICTAYALTASAKLLKKISPFTMMLTVNLEPVYGIILALFVFGNSEKMNTSFYYGALLIFISVILNGIIKSKNNEE